MNLADVILLSIHMYLVMYPLSFVMNNTPAYVNILKHLNFFLAHTYKFSDHTECRCMNLVRQPL
jgi:hypothetical protein